MNNRTQASELLELLDIQFDDTSTAADRFSDRHAMSLAQSSPPASSGSGLRLRAREARKLIALPQ
jgi:hypothetical protein